MADELNNDEGQAAPSTAEGPIATGEDVPPKPKKGRPRKDEPPRISPEPPPKRRKEPGEIRDHYAAIKRLREEQQAHVDAYREEHPEATVGDAVDPFETPKKPGAPIAKNAFLAPVKGLTIAAGALGDVRKDELPSDADYEQCAEEWARASTHLGLSEKGAAMFSAISETVRVTGFTLALSVRNWIRGHNGADQIAQPTKVDGKHEVVK